MVNRKVASKVLSMRELLLVALLLIAVVSAWDGELRVDPHFPDFIKFMVEYNKDIDEEHIHDKFQNFKVTVVTVAATKVDKSEANLENIKRLNARNSSATFGITKFSDMSADEFRSYPCGGLLGDAGFSSKVTQEPKVYNTTRQLPLHWDWGKHGAVTSVKSQGVCGACWAFSTIGNVEGVWAVSKNQLLQLSEQQLIDCSISNFGCQGGWPAAAMKDIISDRVGGKVDTESGYPYAAYTQQCLFNPIKYCTPGERPCNENHMMSWLYNVGPLSVCVDAAILQNYKNGILDPEEDDCDPTYIDHCMLLTGYGEENGIKYWKLKNSWGIDYGEQGYVRFRRGIGACGINRAVASVTV